MEQVEAVTLPSCEEITVVTPAQPLVVHRTNNKPFPRNTSPAKRTAVMF